MNIKRSLTTSLAALLLTITAAAGAVLTLKMGEA